MNAGGWFARALKLLHAGASQDALDALSTAIQLDPEFAEAYAYRGFAYYRLDNYDAAMEDYGKAVALWPNLAEAYYFRAILHGQLKEYQQAIRDYTRAVELKARLDRGILFSSAEPWGSG